MSDDCCTVGEHDATGPFRRVLYVVLAINIGMFVIEIASGLLSGSASLQADALDFLKDSITYAITLMVLGHSMRWRASAAMVKGIAMAGFGGYVLGMTAYKTMFLSLPDAAVMSAVGVAALIANVVSAVLLYKFREGGFERALGLAMQPQRRDRKCRGHRGRRTRLLYGHAVARPARRRADGVARPLERRPDHPPRSRGSERARCGAGGGVTFQERKVGGLLLPGARPNRACHWLLSSDSERCVIVGTCEIDPITADIIPGKSYAFITHVDPSSPPFGNLKSEIGSQISGF